jgi:flavin-dependent dehydrogenase
MESVRQHAIVIGGSMSGMLAARVLSEHYEHVSLIERDQLPEAVELRDGTPQARHAHILLGKGLQILETLFPGIEDEMTAQGAATQHWGRETMVYMQQGWMPDFESTLHTYGISRKLSEWCIRQRIRANSHIQILQRTQVKHLLTADNNQCVIGVEMQQKGGAQTTQLKADLVIDVSGRGSHAPEWLISMGYERTEETVINSYLGYATRWYKRPDSLPKDTKIINIVPLPPHIPRGGLIMEIEHGECIVTLSGANKDYPPTDAAGFLEFARSLLSPAIYEIIRDAEPAPNIYGCQRTENRWRHYERFERWPEGFMVSCDAACAFNPVYGQGMTTGALEAMALGEVLTEYAERNSTGMTKTFQTRLAKVIETPWLMATGEDLRYPGTEGGKTKWQDRVIQKYIQQFINAMPTHPEISDNFVQVMNLLKPPYSLFQPTTFLRVISSMLSRKKVVGGQISIPTEKPIQESL